MAVAWDAFSNSTGATDPSWTHTPAGTPTAVLVFVIQDGATPETVSCTYGGAAMTALTVVDGSAVAEPAVIYPFFKGSSVATGAQTVAVDASGATTKVGFAHTFTGGNSEVDDQDQVLSSSQDDPSVVLTATAEASGASALFSGLGTATNVTAGSGFTKDVGIGTTGDTMHTEHLSSAAAAGSVTFAWTTTAGDDVVMSAVLVKLTAAAETVNIGLVTETESVPGAMTASAGSRRMAMLTGVG